VASETRRGYLLPLMSPRSALLLGVVALVLEVALITPWVDDAADSNSTVHFTQHGLIFVGGILMGWALRDLRLASLFAAER
jgi:cytochrome c oxidase assembly factor CtaG